MSRQRMYSAIRVQLEREGVEITPDVKAVIDSAVGVALEYVKNYAIEVASELITNGLDSHAKVAGLFIRKIKGLMKGE